jgi:hypothetical protein
VKLVMTLLVRDNDDLLATNVEYHLAQGVDFFVATDNRSVDGTREILEHYRSRGVLHRIEEQGDDYSQDRWVTRMARMASTDFGADWVINNDADEFWWPEEAGSVKEVLARCPPEQRAVRAERRDFLPTPEAEHRWFAEAMTVRDAVSVNAMGDPLPPKVCHRASDRVRVQLGNHVVEEQRGLLRRWQPLSATEAGLTIFHFPRVSYARFENKIEKGGAALERNTSLPPEVGETWRKLYETYKRGELRAYWDERVPGPAELEQGLADGTYVTDTRLRDYLAQHVDASEVLRWTRSMQGKDT